MQGAEDILYSATAKIPEVVVPDPDPEAQCAAAADHREGAPDPEVGARHQHDDGGPDGVHLRRRQRAAGRRARRCTTSTSDETNLRAKATGIPTHLEFTQTKSTGVYDFSAPGGIDLIEASLTRNGGLLLPLPGDHATVHKVGDALGLDFRLSGFESAHFDGPRTPNVALGLSPGGQSFDAIADLDDPNVLATAHISNLPSSVEVTMSPDGESATYDASSPIDQITANLLQRDTDDALSIDIGDVPTQFTLQFDAEGSTIAWDASAPTGNIGAAAHLTPASIGGTRTFDASLVIRTSRDLGCVVGQRQRPVRGAGARHRVDPGPGHQPRRLPPARR